MLLNSLVWLDESPWRFWTLCGFAYAIVLVLCFSPDADRFFPGLQKIRWWGRLRSDVTFVLALTAMLILFRWPVFFFPHQLNPDESNYISQTLSLHHDPVFWRSTVSGTSGPINVYPRMLPGLFGISDTFLTSRMMALSIVIGCLAVFHLTCRRFASSTFARLATLAPATFFGLTTNGDFTHYSGEHLPMLLLAIASYLALRLSDSVKRTSELSFLVGCVLGALPFAKLQASVLGLCIAFFCYAFLLGRKESWNQRGKRCAWLTLGGGTVPVIMVLLAVVSGCFEHFWQSYVVMNLGYTANGGSWAQIFAAVPSLRDYMPDFSAYFLGMFLAGMMGLAWIAVSGRWRNLSAAERRLLIFSSAVMAVSIFTALAPGRPFPHYFLFMVLPLAGWAFATFSVSLRGSTGEPRSREVTQLVLAAWCTVALAGQCSDYLMSKQPLELRGHVGEFVKVPRSAVAEAILQHTSPGQPLGLWGWMHEFHVETGTHRATSDMVLEYLWNTKVEGRQVSSWRELVPDYFQNLYVEDFKRSKPPVFVDAVAPGSFIFADHRMFGYETFPALASYVDENYYLAHEIGGIRIFVRKDTLGVVPTGTGDSRAGSADGAAIPSQRVLNQPDVDAETQSKLGMALFKEGRTDDAIEHFQRAVELMPRHAEAWQNLGAAYLRKGLIEKAVTSYRSAAELQPGVAEVQSSLGDALLQAGWIEEAMNHYQSALSIDSNKISSLNNLAWILASRGDGLVRDGVKAVELADRASKLAGGDNAVILNTLAAAYGEAGRYAEALKASQRALDLATAGGNEALAQVIREARGCYSAGRPYHNVSVATVRTALVSP